MTKVIVDFLVICWSAGRGGRCLSVCRQEITRDKSEQWQILRRQKSHFDWQESQESPIKYWWAGPSGIPGFFGICLLSVRGFFKVRQDLLPRPLEVKIFSQWGYIWKFYHPPTPVFFVRFGRTKGEIQVEKGGFSGWFRKKPFLIVISVVNTRQVPRLTWEVKSSSKWVGETD